MLEDEVLKSIAEKHSATVPQICLAWNLARNVSVIPKSTNYDRIKANFEAQKIVLDEEDLEKIGKLDKNRRNFDPKKWDGDLASMWGGCPVWA